MAQHQQDAIVLEPTILEATLDVVTLEAHQKCVLLSLNCSTLGCISGDISVDTV